MITALAAAGQPVRVAPDAVQIRAFRLNDTHLPKLRHIAQTLAREYKPHPERPRADAGMFGVLAMSLAFNEPFRDQTVTDTVRLIESGHLDLALAIRAAGSTTAEYVLTQITLVLTVPVVAREKAGQAASSADTAPENVAFVGRHWSEIESIVNELRAASGQLQ